ncbi:helix-turn-helix domain-containing protein [Salsuginibacillus kocurii]|uniref:helix-turn-helix domain-containing protein n=1 Tax=Salsuginibacillus kocurii TaxID=427078 RepID=UPI000361FB02|nr:helix-turn-helix domain-containing protein [Salsuginibacillus kocurii]
MKRDWLIQLRIDKQLTQEQVATKAFINRGYYSQIETGKRNPGLSIAINIAKALDFEPTLFFSEHLNQETLQNEINEYFKNEDIGEILYLYDNFEVKVHHILIFLSSGIERGSYCVIIDSTKNILDIQQKLSNLLSKDIIKNKICFINKEDMNLDMPANVIPFLRDQYAVDKPLRIWLAEKDTDYKQALLDLGNLLNRQAVNLSNRNILFIHSYDAELISAGTHIQMMRNYPYLMTDTEIVDSPFCTTSNKSYVFPSFYIQENME